MFFFWLLTADFSDQSVGPGPVRAVYERALKILTDERSMWKPHCNGTVTWNVRPIPTTPLRLAKACTAGTLIALGLLWYGMTFHPISFWLVGLCVSTFDELKDLSFIKSIDEELAATLSAWPLDPSTSFPSSESADLSSLIINHLGVTVSDTKPCSIALVTDQDKFSEIRDCTSEERLHYTNELYAQALFQASSESIRIDAELSALKTAFNITITSTLNLCDVSVSIIYSLLHGAH